MNGLDGVLSVSIETTTVCNRRCVYCPMAYYDRGNHLMEQSLFEKIVKELGELQYAKDINLHNFGEPLTDARIVELIGLAHKYTPLARILLFTNGELLTDEKIDSLLAAGVSQFMVSVHFRSRIAYPVLKRLEAASYAIMTYYTGHPQTMAGLHNRGGLLTEAHGLHFVKTHPCYGVHYPVVNYKGDVLLCCDDYFGTTAFGNVGDRSFLSIWNDPRYVDIRAKLAKGGFELDVCRRCNVGGFQV